MKRLVLITGAPGVGKTALCHQLFKAIDGCAWLDADWCWMINPWVPKTAEQKTYVEQTFSRILRGYLNNSHISTVLFSWVMRSARMFDLVTEPLSDIEMEIVKIALVCNPDEHVHPMASDGRRREQVASPDAMEPYLNLGATVIDTSRLTVAETTQAVMAILNGSGTKTSFR